MTHPLKSLVLFVLAVLLQVSTAHATGANIGACDVRQVRLGGEGGAPFTAEAPRIVQLRHGAYVDNLILNGKNHGGGGGQASGVLQLRPDEYINRMVIRHGTYVDRLEFTTNYGRNLAGGGNGGGATSLSNIRVLALGGRSGSFLDQIQITYCANYLH